MKLVPRLYEGQETLSRMSETELIDLINKLLSYARKKFSWRKGIELNDFVNQAIFDLYTNKRGYPPVDKQGKRKDISPFRVLRQIVRSKISHHYKKECYRVLFEEHDEQRLSDFWDLLLYEHARRNGQVDLNAETKLINEELCESVRKLVANDEILGQIVELLIKTPDLKASEIADTLGIPRSDVYNALKRLKRIICRGRGRTDNDPAKRG